MRAILHSTDADAGSRLGAKARALAALEATGLPVPPWFVLASDAFYAALDAPTHRALEGERDVARISEIVARVTPAPETCRELAQALAELCPAGEPVAVRSSSAEEDSVRHSFAGQFESSLFISPARVTQAVAAVWRSAFSPRVLAYRREQGLTGSPRPPAVLIQRMINSERSGVAFGADPVSGRRGVAVVAAVYGLGTLLVSGEHDADTYHVDREGRILVRTIVDKRRAHRPVPGGDGVQSVEVAQQDARRPVLTDDQVRAVAALVRQAGRCFGRPQDIEWAIEGGHLYLLQSRPITTLAGVADPDETIAIWDNSNIAESYGGVTTPLTFSFARQVYEVVYRQFCRIVGVPAEAIARHESTLRCMLGLVRGRVYYNLASWYQILALLPGFSISRRFMEQMMGVKESLPDGVLAGREHPGWRERAHDAVRLARTLGGLLIAHVLLPLRITRFYRRLNDSFAAPPVALEEMRPDELAAYYHDLQRRLLAHWDAPLLNDFFAMVYHGLLRKLVVRWCGVDAASWHNDLLCGEGGMVSTEPARRLREMAHLVATDGRFLDLLTTGDLAKILEAMEQRPELRAQYGAYLDRFGDRCLDELKLESITLRDDPLLLLRSLGQLARSSGPNAGTTPVSAALPEGHLRRQAEQRVRQILARHPLKRLIFSWVLSHARARVRDRENMRFERTRVFGLVRRIFLELGRRFCALDALDAPRDVFYLEADEIFGFIEGTATSTDLKGLVAVRKAEVARNTAAPAPADRFETHGIVHYGNTFSPARIPEGQHGDTRTGIACCPGTARGRVRVIVDPRTAVIRQGDILVAERTDPGWIMLFPLAMGLVVERGSLLSHSAIVAREMGIPAVVSVPGATTWLKDGDWVEVDGGRGMVRRLEVPSGEAGDAQ